MNHPLIEALAKALGINREHLFVSNGSDYIFALLINSFALHQQKHILTHEQAFSIYGVLAHTFNIPVHKAAVDPDWNVNIDNLITECTEHTAIIFIANPNNPTGLLINHEDIIRLLDNIPKTTLLVLDEAYYEFIPPAFQYNSLSLLKKYPNLVITRTFSKIYGLAGLRLGYAVAQSDIINMLQRVQLPFTVNQAALTAAHAALDDEEFLQHSLKTNIEGLKQMRAGFDDLKIKYLPSYTNFLTFECSDDGSILYEYLLNKGIIVRPLHPYQMNNYIRVSIGTEEQNTRFLSALKNYKDKL